MGNCQAIDAAALVIQHPSGRIDRLYWPVTVSEVMRANPGHYVSLIIPLPVSQSEQETQDQEQKTIRYTRVKLLRPTDTLALGHAYRLITSQEVMKVLHAKKHAKMKKQSESVRKQQSTTDEQSSSDQAAQNSSMEKAHQPQKQERHRPRTASTNTASTRPKSWRPSLQSISEASM
ncbi:uncharacterized protein LOC110822876 [Carica papaya]|uniref:uncharacterized protein LOC110822876 n=1 Tax=Carica papaya TaxID=3649 RepID=UPI000B8CCB2E|nr:uncharacterized protein LOC110822876 [Carica papaya]